MDLKDIDVIKIQQFLHRLVIDKTDDLMSTENILSFCLTNKRITALNVTLEQLQSLLKKQQQMECRLFYKHRKAYRLPPIFRNTLVSRTDIGDLMEECAEREGIMAQSKWMLLSSFRSANAALITPSLLFYMDLALICKQNIDSPNTLPQSVLYSPP